MLRITAAAISFWFLEKCFNKKKKIFFSWKIHLKKITWKSLALFRDRNLLKVFFEIFTLFSFEIIFFSVLILLLERQPSLRRSKMQLINARWSKMLRHLRVSCSSKMIKRKEKKYTLISSSYSLSLALVLFRCVEDWNSLWKYKKKNLFLFSTWFSCWKINPKCVCLLVGSYSWNENIRRESLHYVVLDTCSFRSLWFGRVCVAMQSFLVFLLSVRSWRDHPYHVAFFVFVSFCFVPHSAAFTCPRRVRRR